MILNSIISASFVAATVTELYSAPIEGVSFAPSTAIKAIFDNRESSSLLAQDYVSADFSITTKVPAVNIGNFAEVVNVQCTESSLSVTFRELESAQSALGAWNGVKNFAVIVGQEWDSCNGDNIAIYGVSAITAGGRILEMSTSLLDPKDCISDFDLDLNEYESTTPTNGWDVSRDLVTFPVALNYNTDTKTVTNPDIVLAGNEWVSASCVNCHVKGEIKLRARITGKFLQVSTWKLALGGDVAGNADFKVGVLASGRKELIQKNLFTKNFNPITIKGLLQIMPQFKVDAGVYYAAPQEISVTTGFDIQIPMEFSVYSNDGVNGKPQYSASIVPKLTPHPPTLSKGTVIVDAHLIPAFALSA
jgi:hypothetical protein